MMNITDLNKSLAETITPNAIGAASVNEVNKVKNDIDHTGNNQKVKRSPRISERTDHVGKDVEQCRCNKSRKDPYDVKICTVDQIVRSAQKHQNGAGKDCANQCKQG